MVIKSAKNLSLAFDYSIMATPNRCGRRRMTRPRQLYKHCKTVAVSPRLLVAGGLS
jgi:hypothetical protein